MAERPPRPPEALVPENTHFAGPVFFDRAAEILGTVDGSVQGPGSLVVGPRARVKGPVEVADLLLAGEVEGEVTAAERASLVEGATLRGTLRTPRVRIEEGAHLDGPCRIGPVENEVKGKPGSP
jgi:cytoskeletal protein CcmA (bactofilin family)